MTKIVGIVGAGGWTDGWEERRHWENSYCI